MPRLTARYVVGTVRRRLRRSLRRLRGRAARRPYTARVVPRPPRLRRGAAALRLRRVVVASDLNERYLDFWPLAERAWRDVAALEPLLVLVAPADAVPPALRSAANVDVFEPIPDVHTAFQAQCIRLLYPALLPPDAGVAVSDIDLVPLSARYFHHAVAGIPQEHFVSYRDVLLPLGEIPVCYNAALPPVWGDVFSVATAEDVRARLAEWARPVRYSGLHGGAGWTTDQRILYRTLLERGRRARDVWILDDHYTRFRRLERTAVAKNGLTAEHRGLIGLGAYSDYHCLAPQREHRVVNELVVDLAVASARRGLRPGA